MSAIKLIIIRTFFLVSVLLISGKAYSQWRFIDRLADSLLNAQIDTSDYFPYEYTEALDYNLMIAASKGYGSEIKRLIDERNAARKAKDFKKSDEVRNKLSGMGIILEDTKDGTVWRRKA